MSKIDKNKNCYDNVNAVLTKGMKPQKIRFSQLVSTGKSAVDAYIDAFGKGDKSLMSKRQLNSVRASASRLLTDVKVKEYVEFLRSEACKRGEEEAIWGIQEFMRFFTRVMTTSGGDVARDSDLCTGVKYTKDGEEVVEMFSKEKAAELLLRMLGAFAPTESNVNHSMVDDVLDDLEEEDGLVRDSTHS